MALDLLPFTDAIVTLIDDSFSAAGVIGTISREYDVEYDLGTVEGLKVNVFPASYVVDAANPATRIEDFLDIQSAIVILERFTQPGNPPKSWIDERVQWVESLIFSPLVTMECPLLLNSYWRTAVNVSTVWDMTFLREHKVFWSEVEITFRKLRSRV